jgi:amphi-Trp domain-containing protein
MTGQGGFAAGAGGLMSENGKVKFLSTINKDEAAFHLSELAKGLLRNRISIPVGERNLIMATFDSIRLEMKAHDLEDRYAIDVRLSWRKRPPSIANVGADEDPRLGKRREESVRG